MSCSPFLLVNEQLIEGKIMKVRGRTQKKSCVRKDDLIQIFHFFRWNAEFQKQRKESLVSLLKPKKESLVQQFARKYSSLTGKK